MTTLAFRVSGQPAPRRVPTTARSKRLPNIGGAASILAYIAALAALVALVVAVRVGLYALGHTDLPIFRMLVDRFFA